MKTKKLLNIGIIMAMILPIISCTKHTPTPPPSPVPPPPIATQSVVPNLNKVSTGIDATINTNTRIDAKVKQQKEEVVLQQLTITETISQAEKVKDKVLANEAIKEIEMVNIINGLKKIESRNLFLEKQNNDMDVIVKEQTTLLNKARLDVSETMQKLQNKENEANELRLQNTYLASELSKKNLLVEQIKFDKDKEIAKVKSDLEKEKVHAANASVYKHWVLGLIGIFIAWTIIKNLLMIYFPATRFRI